MAPAPIFCFDKQKRIAAFVNAVSEYHRMLSAQVESMLKGEGLRFEDEVTRARERRDNAKYAVLAHKEAHGC